MRKRPLILILTIGIGLIFFGQNFMRRGPVHLDRKFQPLIEPPAPNRIVVPGTKDYWAPDLRNSDRPEDVAKKMAWHLVGKPLQDKTRRNVSSVSEEGTQPSEKDEFSLVWLDSNGRQSLRAGSLTCNYSAFEQSMKVQAESEVGKFEMEHSLRDEQSRMNLHWDW